MSAVDAVPPVANGNFEAYIQQFDNLIAEAVVLFFRGAGEPILGAKLLAEYFRIPARQLTSQA
jgi:hypothetical protein